MMTPLKRPDTCQCQWGQTDLKKLDSDAPYKLWILLLRVQKGWRPSDSVSENDVCEWKVYPVQASASVQGEERAWGESVHSTYQLELNLKNAGTSLPRAVLFSSLHHRLLAPPTSSGGYDANHNLETLDSLSLASCSCGQAAFTAWAPLSDWHSLSYLIRQMSIEVMNANPTSSR